MADYRQLHTKIWADSWFMDLSPEQKLLFIYLFGNQRASVCGLFELPIRMISFESGLDREVIKKCLEVFKIADKVDYDFEASVVWVKNMPKYQSSTSPKLKKRIEADIKAVPGCDLKAKFLKTYPMDTLSDRDGYDMDTLQSVSVSDSVSESVSLSDSESEEERKEEISPQKPEFSYWTTLIENIEYDRDIPKSSRAKIMQGKPVDFEDKTLFVRHPEPDWANRRWAKTLSNLMQGLCAMGRVKFVP